MYTQAQKDADKRYRLNHPDKIKAKEKKRWKENREKESKRNRDYHIKNKDRVNLRSRLNRHKITEQELNDMLRKQRNCCAICCEKFIKTPHIDHCHKTNKNRALLCDDCNLGLGRFKDNKKFLGNAIKYLEKHQ